MCLLEQNIPASRENGKTGPAQEKCACRHGMQSLSCKRQLIVCLLFRAATCFFGTGPRWATGWFCLLIAYQYAKHELIHSCGTSRPAWWSPADWRGRTIMLISCFLFLSMSCCYDLQQVTPLFLCFLSSHGHNSCFLIPSSHPLISPLILIPLC